MIEYEALKAMIVENLDNAQCNEYDQRTMSMEEVLSDLCDYAADIGEVVGDLELRDQPELLRMMTQAVTEWQIDKCRGLTN